MRLSTEKALKHVRAGHTIWQVWGHAHQNRFTTPHEERLEVYVRSQTFSGKRKHQEFGPGYNEICHLLNGSLGGVYFTKRFQAEKYAQEIREGFHPDVLWKMREDADAFDMLDEEMGICDRGMGLYTEPTEYDYPYDELEFA